MKIKNLNYFKYTNRLIQFTFLILAMIISSCSKDDMFQNIIEIETKEIINSDSLGYANELIVCNNFLVVYDSKPLYNENQLRVYNSNTFEFVMSTGRFGAGPGEFKNGASLNRVNESKFSLIDFSSFNVLFYSLDNNGNIKYEKAINLKKKMPYTPTVINDSTIYSLAFEIKSGRFAEYDSSGLFKRTLGEIPPGKKKDTPVTVHQLASKGLMKLTPDGTKIIISYQFADLIEVYNVNGTLIRRIEGPQKKLPLYNIKYVGGYPNAIFDNSKCILGYIDIEVTNSHILALYSGNFTDSKHEGSYLHVFTHDGVLIKNYLLKNPMSQIAIDRVNNRILATHFFSKPKIFRFEEDFEYINL